MDETIHVDNDELGKTTKSPAGGSGSGKSRVKSASSPIDTLIINKYNNGWDSNRIAALYMVQKSYVEKIINR